MTKKGISPAALKALMDGDITNFFVASTPGGIEAQEAQGQRNLVSNAWIPKEMVQGCTKEKLESLGIVFVREVDDLFWEAELPEGWKIEPTEHSMQSYLLDDKRRKRAGIFYKAAFYDRSANIYLIPRFILVGYESCDCNGNETEYNKATHIKTVVKDQEKEIFVAGTREGNDTEAADTHEKIALEWLEENYPDWENPLAYWE